MAKPNNARWGQANAFRTANDNGCDSGKSQKI